MTLQQLNITYFFGDLKTVKGEKLLEHVGHKEAVKFAMECAADLRKQGIMDAIGIAPVDVEDYVVFRERL